MEFNSYQITASKAAIYPNIGQNITYPALGLCGEAGEIAEKIKKIYRDEQGKISPETRQALTKELGDVLWYISAMCGELGVELEEVALLNLQKLNKRKETNTLNGNGDNREDLSSFISCHCHGGRDIPSIFCFCKINKQ